MIRFNSLGSKVSLEEIHKLCIYNRETIGESTMCGCFFCIHVFEPTEIESWTDDGRTAHCPRCEIDSVLPDSQVEITEELLVQMCEKYFIGEPSVE